MKCVSPIVLTFISALAVHCLASEEQHPEHRWIARLERDIAELSVDDQEHPLAILAISKAEACDAAGATALVFEALPQQRRAQMLGFIAAIQAQAGKLHDATDTVNRLRSRDSQQQAWKWVIRTLARDQRTDDARALLKHIDEVSLRDHALAELAKAHARKREYRAARSTVAEIESEDVREDTISSIDKTESGATETIDLLQPGFMRTRISMLVAFARPDTYRDAILAIAAAQRGNDAEFVKHLRPALDYAKQPTLEPRLSTTAILFAVALAEAGRAVEAKRLIMAAFKAADRDPIGVTRGFGRPILVYLLLKLEMEQSLDKMLKVGRKNNDGSNCSFVQAVGEAYAVLGRLADADAFYNRLDDANEKVELSNGILTGLQYRQRTR